MPLKNPLLRSDFITLSSGSLTTEASSLGLRAGEQAPPRLELGEDTFWAIRTVQRDGEVQSWEYRNRAGHRLVLIND